MPYLLLSSEGLVSNDRKYDLIPDAYLMRNNGKLVYSSGNVEKYYGSEMKRILDDPVRGYVESDDELFTIFSDYILSESGHRHHLDVKKNITITKDKHEILVMNGNGIHFFGLCRETFMFSGLVVGFSKCWELWENLSFRVYTIQQDGLFECYRIVENEQKLQFTRIANMTHIRDKVYLAKVNLWTYCYYVVDFKSGFASPSRGDVSDIYENGQNMIIEYEDQPYYELAEYGKNTRVIVPEVEFIKNVKSARSL